MNQKKIFQVIFDDGAQFEEGTIIDPLWKNCPDKKIRLLEVLLPYGDKIILKDYDKFNFFIGAIRTFGNNSPKILHIYALGCKKGLVTSYRITVSSEKNQKYKIGDITVRQFPFGKEGIGQTATSGWK